MSLKEFLSRPVKVSALSWVPGTALNTSVSIANYLALTPIKHKLNQFSRMRFTQCVTVSFTANPFYSGSLLLSALPLGNYDILEPARLPATPDAADYVRLSQRPNLFMTANQSQTMTLKLPYFSVYNWYSLNQSEVAVTDNFYKIYLNSINNLAHCNGSTDPLTVNIFFSLEDVQLEVPTTYYAASGEKKPVSTALQKLSTISEKAGEFFPVIKPYSTPLSMAAKLGADLAKVLGYSRPFLVNDPTVRTCNPMSVTDQPDPRPMMSLSSGNSIGLGAELNLSPEILEMDLVKLAQRYSYLHQVTWNVSSAVDTTLLTSGVTPVVYKTKSTEYHYPGISYLSLPFSHWSGTINYKIQAIASGMHRGILRITWDPYPTNDINTPGFYSTPFTVLLDLEKTHEVELKIPFHSIYNTLFTSPQSFPIAVGGNVTTCNGYFTISVMNALNTPNNTVDTPVPINIWIAAGDDYAVYRPGKNIRTLSYFAASGTVGNKTKVHISSITHGELITSIRALVKREQYSYNYANYNSGASGYFMLFDFDRPIFRGTKSQSTARTLTMGTSVPFDFGYNNFLTHYEGCFAARRGGYNIRYNDSFTTAHKCRLSDHSFTDPGSANTNPAFNMIPLTAGQTGAVMLTIALPASITGTEATEVDTSFGTVAGRKPYYSNLAMLPNRYGLVNWGAGTYTQLYGPAHSVTGILGSTSNACVTKMVSAGEDYQLLFYIGPPIIYSFESPAWNS